MTHRLTNHSIDVQLFCIPLLVYKLMSFSKHIFFQLFSELYLLQTKEFKSKNTFEYLPKQKPIIKTLDKTYVKYLECISHVNPMTSDAKRRTAWVPTSDDQCHRSRSSESADQWSLVCGRGTGLAELSIVCNSTSYLNIPLLIHIISQTIIWFSHLCAITRCLGHWFDEWANRTISQRSQR